MTFLIVFCEIASPGKILPDLSCDTRDRSGQVRSGVFAKLNSKYHMNYSY